MMIVTLYTPKLNIWLACRDNISILLTSFSWRFGPFNLSGFLKWDNVTLLKPLAKMNLCFDQALSRVVMTFDSFKFYPLDLLLASSLNEPFSETSFLQITTSMHYMGTEPGQFSSSLQVGSKFRPLICFLSPSSNEPYKNFKFIEVLTFAS